MQGDLFGYTPRPKRQSSQKKVAPVKGPVIGFEPNFAVYRPDLLPVGALVASIVAFLLWYIFGAQIVQLGPIEFKELSSPLYGALAWFALVCCLFWFGASFIRNEVCYFQAEPDRRIWKRYSNKTRARFWSFSIRLLSVMLIAFSCLLVFHGTGNAKKFGLLAYEKLSRPPSEAEIKIAAQRPIILERQAPPVGGHRIDMIAGPYETADAATVPPTVGDPKNMIETGSIKPPPRVSKKVVVSEVDPLTKSVDAIVNWFDALLFKPVQVLRR